MAQNQLNHPKNLSSATSAADDHHSPQQCPASFVPPMLVSGVTKAAAADRTPAPQNPVHEHQARVSAHFATKSRFPAKGAVNMDMQTWQTASGKTLSGAHEIVDKFTLKDNMLYILAQNGRALWIGSGTDVINDIESRHAFKAALKLVTDVLRLPAPSDETDRFCLIHDLFGGHQISSMRAA